MRDLELWRLARARLERAAPERDAKQAKRLVLLLDELARLDASQRASFAGRLLGLLEDPEASLREAAVRCLSGATGVVGLRAIVGALDDDDEGVRQAAVAALVEVARQQPMRLTHAVFHPRADVRRAVLMSNLPRDADGLGIYLRADPHNADLAATCPWPEKSLELLFDFRHRGFVEPDEATRRLALTAVADMRQTLLHGYRRNEAELSAWLGAFEAGHPASTDTPDVIDRWCEAFDPASKHARQALVVFRQAVLGTRLPRLARRAAVSLLHTGLALRQVEALAICVAAEPALLASAGLSLEARRDAAWTLLDDDVRGRRCPESMVTGLFDSDLVLGEGTAPDLASAVCVAGLLPRKRLGTVLRHFGEEQVVSGLVEDLRPWIAMCRLPAESKGGTDMLLGRLRNLAPTRYAEMLAVAVATWYRPTPDRVHELVRERIKPRLAGKVLLALITLVVDGRAPLKDKTWGQVMGVLVDRANETDLRAVAEAALMPTGVAASKLRPEEADGRAAVLLKRMAAKLSAKSFALSMGGLADAALLELLRLAEDSLMLARDYELTLARTVRGHPLEAVASWAEGRLRGDKVRQNTVTRRRVSRSPRRLSEAETKAIETADLADLDGGLGPALSAPTAGLCAALGARSVVEPRTFAVVALFGCTDPLAEVAEALDPWVDDTVASWAGIRTFAVASWQGMKGLPPQTDALLHRWEGHELAFADWLEGEKGEALLEHFEAVVALPGLYLRRTLFEAMGSIAERWRYRNLERLARWDQAPIYEALFMLLDSECGCSAARILVALHECEFGEVVFSREEERVRELEPDLDDDTRRALDRWIPFRGRGAARVLPRRRDPLPPADLLARISGSEDLTFLEQMCCRHELSLVHEACLRLVVLGREGQLRVLSLLKRSPELRGLSVFLDSVALWTDLGCVAAVRVMAMDPSLSPRLRFRLCLALHERGEGGFVERALAAVAEPGERVEEGWFTRKDRGRLRRAVDDELHMLVSLARSPHPHAYRHAVRGLLDADTETRARPEVRRALASFLEQGTRRVPELRVRCAQALVDLMSEVEAQQCGYEVILLPPWMQGYIGGAMFRGRLGPAGNEGVARSAIDAALVFGPEGCTEAHANAIANTHPGPDPVRLHAELRRRLFDDGTDPNLRKLLIRQLSGHVGSDQKLARVAEVFAWGVRRGRELTGHVFKVHMTDKRADYGFTFMNQKRIYVTALPLMRGDRHGRDVVEALILHEFGHHMYHGGKEADAVWKRAQREGLHQILNLVADEHLERNLRAIDPAYGDRLKRLAAFAFGHSARALQVSSLIEMLLGGSFAVMSAEQLGVAYEPDRVEVQRGALLRELDRRGHPYARFVRALRMGLGNRSRDPQLEQALELFRGGFRHLDMKGLYEVTLALADIYGGAQALGKVFGGHEDLEWEDRDSEMHGAGVSDEAVQREVERILQPPRQGDGKRLGKAGRLTINVGSDTHFDPIETIERVAPNQERHRQLASELRRYSGRLREYLERLGLAHVPRRARLRGRAFDRTRAQAVVIRRDPRMLVARELTIDTDLFVGVVVDCSGSMSVGKRMEVAHRFGVLIAEAVAPLAGVDARFFGFTDSKIYDAGDQHHCAVTSLVASGGNNDAAGLYHAAQAATASTRKAKLLVMISDGLPTECSVSALRSLVTQLGRKGLVCAQVAVRALEEECFPHYVVIEDDDVEASVRRFGEIVCRLVGRTLGRA